jgi:lysophospholipase L1-like esterase
MQRKTHTIRSQTRSSFGVMLLSLFYFAVRIIIPSPALADATARSAPVSAQNTATSASPATIVFTGSSSIAYWRTLAQDMKPLKIVNTGVGGTQYSDLLKDMDHLVFAWHPAAVVVYSGDNDLASPTSKTPQIVAADVQKFVQVVHSKLPQTWIYVLSIKPSILRWRDWPQMNAANHLIEESLRTQDRARFIDIASAMLDSQGLDSQLPDSQSPYSQSPYSQSKVPPDLFIRDGLHPSAKCYALWTSIIKPVLLQRFGSQATGAR